MTPKLPEPWDYAYEWDGPFGTRKFSAAQYNGRKPDRSVPVYTSDQMREMWKQGMERAAEICDDLADWHQLIRDSRGENIVNNCSDAIRKEITP